jgi:hypothetical protein
MPWIAKLMATSQSGRVGFLPINGNIAEPPAVGFDKL